MYSLKQRFTNLKKELETQHTNPVQQMDSLLQYGNQIIHGPNTPAQFPEFSVEKTNAAYIHQLFLQLGDTEKNRRNNERVEEGDRISVYNCECIVLNSKWSPTSLELHVGCTSYRQTGEV